MQDVQDNLIIIKHDQAVGSGFIAKMGDKYYIITNQHVILGANRITFHTVSGRQLSPRRVEVAATRDIARLELSDVQDGFEITGQADMYMPIAVFGNSQGAGVATELYGKVTGIGNDRIEIDAEFVTGNSGSPVITADGQVTGIASYVKYGSDDHTGTNTEFKDKARRFAYRINGTRWQSVNWRDYNKHYGIPLRKNEALISSIFDIVQNWYRDPFTKITIEKHPVQDLCRWSTEHNHMVNRIIRTLDKGRASEYELGNTNKRIRKDLVDSAETLSEICTSNARKMRMLATQRNLNGYLKDQFLQLSYSLEEASETLEEFRDELASLNYFEFEEDPSTED